VEWSSSFYQFDEEVCDELMSCLNVKKVCLSSVTPLCNFTHSVLLSTMAEAPGLFQKGLFEHKSKHAHFCIKLATNNIEPNLASH